MLRPSEDELIAAYFAPLAGAGAHGLLDDAASLASAPGQDLVLTKDLLVAAVHFFNDDPPGDIARKALRVNLSDLAAKGAEPLGFLLGLALPQDWTADWLKAFAEGLGSDSAAFACPLLGGDTIRTPGPLTISITAIGAVPSGGMVPRGGVAAGDHIYVTGTIGDAALGLKLRHDAAAGRSWTQALSAAAADHLRRRYLLPEPRVALRGSLRRHARAAMDVSDGFGGDLAKMLGLSALSARVSIESVPLSAAAREALSLEPRLIETILTGGDDYEILCAIAPADRAAFEASAAADGTTVTRVAETFDGGQGVLFQAPSGEILRLEKLSFQHF
ncbi:thiamine-phosphate kinase [Methylocapsa palsarum]|nr:thiamine-phosphate kinase [Methylocapsa palsarum]